MKLSGFVRDSFQEYGGQQSLVLFCTECNLSCPECYNLEQIRDPARALPDAALAVINREATPLTDAVVFLGGEPTVWADLPAAAAHVKSKGMKAKVFTNGLRPDMVSGLNSTNLVDAWSVDLKTVDSTIPLGLDISIEEYLSSVDKTIQNIIVHAVPLEIRTTKWRNTDWHKVAAYAAEHYPGIRHILQPKFQVVRY